MIKEHDQKIEQIIECIKNNRIQEIDEKFGNGPELYFYKKLMQLRSNSKSAKSFLTDAYNLEILYATLVAWGMNCRAAKMKYIDDFKDNILSCEERFEQLESFWAKGNISTNNLVGPLLKEIYQSLHVMKTEARLVSNSKLLHFLFPEMLMPMDGKNTLNYFYGNTGESVQKYIEIIKFSSEIMDMKDMKENWQKYSSGDWNTTIPKMIDNAIILLVGKSD